MKQSDLNQSTRKPSKPSFPRGPADTDASSGSEQISDGIRADVSDFGPREGQGLEPGPSGVQSGVSTPSVTHHMHTTNDFPGESDQTRRTPSNTDERFEKDNEYFNFAEGKDKVGADEQGRESGLTKGRPSPSPRVSQSQTSSGERETSTGIENSSDRDA